MTVRTPHMAGMIAMKKDNFWKESGRSLRQMQCHLKSIPIMPMWFNKNWKAAVSKRHHYQRSRSPHNKKQSPKETSLSPFRDQQQLPNQKPLLLYRFRRLNFKLRKQFANSKNTNRMKKAMRNQKSLSWNQGEAGMRWRWPLQDPQPQDQSGFSRLKTNFKANHMDEDFLVWMNLKNLRLPAASLKRTTHLVAKPINPSNKKNCLILTARDRTSRKVRLKTPALISLRKYSIQPKKSKQKRLNKLSLKFQTRWNLSLTKN